MPIITISRGSLSGGTALAECVAQRLGYGCVSREVLVEAAAKYGVPEAKLSDFLDKVPGFWERLTVSRRLYLLFIQAMMCEFAQQGNLVYHGHAGHLLLKGIDHVLKVRLIARLAYRITAVMERQGVSPKAALHYIQQVDEERRRRMRDLFEVDGRDPALYDVVVNLEEMSMETAADVVVSLAQHTEYQPTVSSQKALDDLTLRCRVQAAIAAHPATIGIMVEAQDDGGSVRLAGVVECNELHEDIIHIAQTVPGVQEVIADLEVRPIFPSAEL